VPVDGEPTARVVYTPDHRTQAVNRLLAQFKDSPRLRALVATVGQMAQIAEDEWWNVYQGRLLDMAEGDALDKLGELVGEARWSLTDDEYRRIIRARVLANVCDDSIDEILEVWALLLSPTSKYKYKALYPAGFELHAWRGEPMRELYRRRVRRIMDSIKPSGVGMELVEIYSGYFGFEEDPEAEAYEVGRWARNV